MMDRQIHQRSCVRTLCPEACRHDALSGVQPERRLAGRLIQNSLALATFRGLHTRQAKCRRSAIWQDFEPDLARLADGTAQSQTVMHLLQTRECLFDLQQGHPGCRLQRYCLMEPANRPQCVEEQVLNRGQPDGTCYGRGDAHSLGLCCNPRQPLRGLVPKHIADTEAQTLLASQADQADGADAIAA